MKKFVKTAVVAALGLSLLLTGCGSKSTSGDSAATINIGGNLEITGPVAQYGQNADKGIKMAVDEINAKGGILGKQIKYIPADNKSDAGESTGATTKLIAQDKVVAILGPMTSGNTRAATQVVTDNKVLLITPTGTADNLTIDQPWIFRACFNDSFQGQIAAAFAQDSLKAKTAALYVQKGDYSQGLAKSFKENFKGEIVFEGEYVAGDKDFKAVLTSMRATNPDVVFIPGYYGEVGIIVKQARELGINAPMLGGDGWDDPSLVEIAGADKLNNTYMVSHASLEDPALAKFVADFEAKYGASPNPFAALGYDAAYILFMAIEKAGEVDSEKIRQALENLGSFEGVSGTMNLDAATHNPIKSAVILEFKDGTPTFLSRVNP